MELNAIYLLLIIFLFLWTKNPNSFSEIRSETSLVNLGSSFKLNCPVKTNNHYSVKWYKDGKELCRYTAMKKLNITNILRKNRNQQKNYICDSTKIDLLEFDITSSGLYACHVVEVGKRKKIIKRTVAVLVYPTNGPVISGIKSSYEEGEIIQAICTASPSNPPPSLVWYINGVAAYGWSMFSYPCKMTEEGLCVLRLGLKISATRNMFPKGVASFVCEATILALPPKRAFVTSVLKGTNNAGSIHLFFGGVLGTIIWQILLLL